MWRMRRRHITRSSTAVLVVLPRRTSHCVRKGRRHRMRISDTGRTRSIRNRLLAGDTDPVAASKKASGRAQQPRMAAGVAPWRPTLIRVSRRGSRRARAMVSRRAIARVSWRHQAEKSLALGLLLFTTALGLAAVGSSRAPSPRAGSRRRPGKRGGVERAVRPDFPAAAHHIWSWRSGSPGASALRRRSSHCGTRSLPARRSAGPGGAAARG